MNKIIATIIVIVVVLGSYYLMKQSILAPENGRVSETEADESKECIGDSCIVEDNQEKINNFDECAEAGYSILESYPRQCKTENKTFTEEHCVDKDTKNILTLTDARQIAIESECGDKLKDTYVCNENTGTYWIDLDIEKQGCSPACVIDIVTREAVINWRCTGLIQ